MGAGSPGGSREGGRVPPGFHGQQRFAPATVPQERQVKTVSWPSRTSCRSQRCSEGWLEGRADPERQ